MFEHVDVKNGVKPPAGKGGDGADTDRCPSYLSCCSAEVRRKVRILLKAMDRAYLGVVHRRDVGPNACANFEYVACDVGAKGQRPYNFSSFLAREKVSNSFPTYLKATSLSYNSYTIHLASASAWLHIVSTLSAKMR